MLIAGLFLRIGALLGCITIAAYPTASRAAPLFPLPATLYPPHTRITAIEPLTNAQMDCDWGFDCHNGQPVSAAPVFHLRTQDELHRLSGWAQFGDATGRDHRMLFALFASTYDSVGTDGLPGNVMAFSDFRSVLMMEGYRDLTHFSGLLPRGVVGNSSAQLATSRDDDVLAMSCWVGAVEVEGIVIYRHGSRTAHRLAMDDLSHQVRAAVTHLGTQ